MCFTSTGTVSGSVGHGTVTFYETIENDGALVDTDSKLGCAKAYGDIEIVGSKDVESTGFVAADCLSDDFGSDAFTSAELVSGGCILDTTNPKKPSRLFSAAFGPCSGDYGTLKGNGFPLTFKISGKALKK